jgi:TM2 domain-containing membrane protein YozV
LGIHNFYAGRNGVAVAQLLITVLTCWLLFPLIIVGVWVIIEICTVTTDGKGNKFS